MNKDRMLNIAIRILIALMVSFSLFPADDQAKGAAEDKRNSGPNTAFVVNVMGLSSVTLGLIANNNRNMNGYTGNFLIGAGLAAIVVGTGLSAAGPTASAVLPVAEPAEKLKNSLETMRSAEEMITDLKNTKGIAVQEGIEIEKVMISANAQSLGFSSRESSQLSLSGKVSLHEIAGIIKSTRSRGVEVIGYTDNQGTESANRVLSEQRARKVVDYYVKEEGLPESMFTVKGMGNLNPIAGSGGLKDSMLNNRIETNYQAEKVQGETLLAEKLDLLNYMPGINVKKEVVAVESVVTMGEEALRFPLNAYEVTDEHKAVLDKIAGAVAAAIMDKDECRVQVKGHTDNVGTKEINLALSAKRANSVIEYLVRKRSVPAGVLECIGCGDSIPIADNSTVEGRNKNRRVEVVLIRKGGKK